MTSEKNRPNGTPVSQVQCELETERLLGQIARKFIHVTPAEIDKQIENCLEAITTFADVGRGYIYFFKDENTSLELAFESNPRNLKDKISAHDRVNGNDFNWFVEPLLNKEIIIIPSADKLPPAATTIKMIMDVEESKSMIVCPMISGDIVTGYIGFDSEKNDREWTSEDEYLLKTCAYIFQGAIDRRDTVKFGIRTEQKMRSLFRGIEDVVFISNPEGKLLEINPAGAKLFGFDSVKDLLKIENVGDFYVNPKERQKYKKVMERNGHVKDYEITLKRNDGTKIIVLETATAIRNEEGDVVSYEGIMRDITDKRHLEQQLFQAQKMESIGLLAGGIAHDFNNILTALIGYAQLILMSSNEGDSHYNNIKNILRSGKKAENLIRQLLAFSRKQMIELQIIDINQVITDLHSMLSRLLPESINFVLRLSPDVNNIKADTVQIQQILVNLVVNAGHAINELGESKQPKKITISTSKTILSDAFIKTHPGSRKGNYNLLSVEDTGIGMDEQTKQKIFEPFYTTKKEKGGTGLGLSTVYGIVKQNAGYIAVESELGKGSSFNVYWPATTDDMRTTTIPDSDLKIEARTESILFVEDDEDVRELACTGLKTLGYRVTEARNGAHALKIIKRKELINKIDIVVTDMVMPEMGGEELARQLRELNPKIKILLCSGYTDSRIFMLESEGLEGYSFLAKPYTIHKLEKKIRAVLRGER